MRRAPALLLLCVLAWTGSGDAPAQTQTRSATVYRCGPDGRDLRDSPCPSQPKASASRIDFDQPSAADSDSARRRAIEAAKRADSMEQARLRAEAQQRRAAAKATGIDGMTGAKPAAKPDPEAVGSKRPKTAKPSNPSGPAKRPAATASASG